MPWNTKYQPCGSDQPTSLYINSPSMLSATPPICVIPSAVIPLVERCKSQASDVQAVTSTDRKWNEYNLHHRRVAGIHVAPKGYCKHPDASCERPAFSAASTYVSRSSYPTWKPQNMMVFFTVRREVPPNEGVRADELSPNRRRRKRRIKYDRKPRVECSVASDLLTPEVRVAAPPEMGQRLIRNVYTSSE
ncbi:hypothetical protein PENSPDRAFT_67099 [Peniophora sp. CONT]|nr:hypothetical protein PENSPDRAFT_67099 [Peniophora sp. CONT]